MSLTYGLETPRHLLEKLHRERERLNEQVTIDSFFNFVVTGYHVMDWVKKHPTTPAPALADLNSLYSVECIALCRDLANASKHFTLDPTYKGQVLDRTSLGTSYGDGRFGKGGFGQGEASIAVYTKAKHARSTALELADDVIATWDGFFAKHGL